MTCTRLIVGLAAVLLSAPVAAQVPGPAGPPVPVIVTRAEASVKRPADRAWINVATETRDARAEEARRESAEVTTEVQSGRGEIRGYVVRNRVEVRVDDLDKLAAVIDAVQTRAGTGLSLVGPRFDLKNEREAQAEALKQAVQYARARAEAMAAGAGRALGPIVRIEEMGSMPIPVRPEPMAFRAATAEAAPETPITPGEIEVTASVTLTIEIR
jgi:uncharacterized protein YggE